MINDKVVQKINETFNYSFLSKKGSLNIIPIGFDGNSCFVEISLKAKKRCLAGSLIQETLIFQDDLRRHVEFICNLFNMELKKGFFVFSYALTEPTNNDIEHAKEVQAEQDAIEQAVATSGGAI